MHGQSHIKRSSRLDWVWVTQFEGQSTILNFRILYSARISWLTKSYCLFKKDINPLNQFICLYVNTVISMKLPFYDFIHTDGL